MYVCLGICRRFGYDVEVFLEWVYWYYVCAEVLIEFGVCVSVT